MKTKNFYVIHVLMFFFATSCNREQALEPLKKESGLISSADSLARLGNSTVVSTITGGSHSPSDTNKVVPISTTSGNNNHENDTAKVVIYPPSTITDPNLIAHLDTISKTLITGEWEEFSECNKCHTLIFKSNGELNFIDNLAKTQENYFYKVLSKDLISVKWESNTFKSFSYSFKSTDTLVIKQFLPVDYGITGYQDILLIKK